MHLGFGFNKLFRNSTVLVARLLKYPKWMIDGFVTGIIYGTKEYQNCQNFPLWATSVSHSFLLYLFVGHRGLHDQMHKSIKSDDQREGRVQTFGRFEPIPILKVQRYNP